MVDARHSLIHGGVPERHKHQKNERDNALSHLARRMRHRFAEASDKKTHQARVNEYCEMVHVDAVAELTVRLCFVQRNRDALLSQAAIRMHPLPDILCFSCDFAP
jgi:hypothetical protein